MMLRAAFVFALAVISGSASPGTAHDFDDPPGRAGWGEDWRFEGFNGDSTQALFIEASNLSKAGNAVNFEILIVRRSSGRAATIVTNKHYLGDCLADRVRVTGEWSFQRGVALPPPIVMAEDNQDRVPTEGSFLEWSLKAACGLEKLPPEKIEQPEEWIKWPRPK
jgi:hypothetical protein